jgi:HAD superfamily hydrolase (TIGR01549 family)
MIDTVLLDFYGTIAVYGDMATANRQTWDTIYAYLSDVNGVLGLDEFTPKWKREFSRQIGLAELTEETVFTTKIARVARECGVPLASATVKQIAEDCLQVWHSFITFPENLHDVLGQLSCRVSLGLVSNFDHPTYLRALLRRLDIEDAFSSVVISGEVGASKPNPTIFLHALTELQADPARALFVGDSPSEDIEGAQSVGCVPILMDMDDHFPHYQGTKIRRLEELLSLELGDIGGVGARL